VRRAVILAGGEIKDPVWHRSLLRPGDLIICADSGAEHARRMGVVPALAVGDMDSIAASGRQYLAEIGCPVIPYPAAKNQTDTQLALERAVSMDATEILLLGCLGNRLDHTLANVALLQYARRLGVDARLEDERHRVMLVHGIRVVEGMPGDIVTLLAVTPQATGVDLAGFQYPLQGGVLVAGDTLGVSNVLLGNHGRVHIGEGVALLIQVKCAGAHPG